MIDTASSTEQMVEEGRRRRIEQLRARGWDAVRIKAQLEKDDREARRWGAEKRPAVAVDEVVRAGEPAGDSLSSGRSERRPLGFWGVVGAVVVADLLIGLLAALSYALAVSR